MIATGKRLPGLLLLVCILQGCTSLPDAPPVLGKNSSDPRMALLDEIQDEMLAIPAGTFQMGSTSGIGEDEHPAHRVSLRAFHLSRFEITRAQYQVFLRAMGRSAEKGPTDGSDHPAVNVSWDDAQRFISWLNGSSGEGYRLPTEAEWEYAARAGSATEYSWGDLFERDYLNGTGVGGHDQWLETAPVGRFPANAFGLHDMLGNVWEWTADCYHPDYENAPVDGSAHTGEETCGRVLRGGSWSDIPAWLRTATRNWFDRGDHFDYVGLRLARD